MQSKTSMTNTKYSKCPCIVKHRYVRSHLCSQMLSVLRSGIIVLDIIEVVTHSATKSICLPGMQMTNSSEWKQQTALEIKLLNKVSVKVNRDARHRTTLKAHNILEV